MSPKRRWNGLMPWTVAGLILASFGAAPGVDRVLVPLELRGQECSAAVRKALGDAEAGRIREAVETLQGALEAARGRDAQDGGEASTSYSESGAHGTIVLVPPEIPRDAKEIGAWLDRVLPGADGDTDGKVEGSAKGAEGGGERAREVATAPSEPSLRPTRPSPRRIAPRVPLRDDLVAGASPEAPAPGRRYLRCSLLVEAALRALPAEGLAMYRTLYDDMARQLLVSFETSEDRDALERVAEEYFLTSSGDDAAEIIGDLLHESGDYTGALGWWRKILDEHPASDLPERRVRGKILLALRLLGRPKEYAAERERHLAAAAGNASTIAQLEKTVPVIPPGDGPPPRVASRWGGELWDSSPPDLPESPLGLSWDSWVWSRQGVNLLDGGALRGRFARDARFLDPSACHYPFLPLLEGQSAYVSGVFSIFKLDARPGGGAVVREYKKPFSPELSGHVEDGDSALHTVTLWKRDVEACPGLELLPRELLITQYVVDLVKPFNYLGYPVTGKLPIRGLVAFDAQTGAMVWRTGTATAQVAEAEGRKGPEAGRRVQVDDSAAAAEALEDWVLLGEDGDLEVVNDRTLLRVRRLFGELGVNQTAAMKDFSYTSPVVVRRGIAACGGWVQRGYVSAALRGLDLATGKVVWEAPIVNSGAVERTMFGELAREPFAGSIAERGGVVYYLTHMGAVAAVDIETGGILWLSTYDAIPVPASQGRMLLQRDTSWGPNPLLLLGNVLIAAPRDSENLLAFDLGTGPDGHRGAGRVLWRYPNLPGRSGLGGQLRDVLGVHQGRLYLSGGDEISYLDLSSLDARGLLSSDGKRLEVPEKFRLSPRTVLQVVAPGALTAQGIVFADPEGLRLLRADRLGIQDLALQTFRESELGLYGGRVQVAGGLVVVTSRHMVSAYATAPGAGVRGAGE